MLLRYICVDNKCKLYSSHAFYSAKKTKQNKTNKTRMNLSKKSITSSSTKRKTSLLLPLISCIWLWRISENDANNLSNEENCTGSCFKHTAEKTFDKNSINLYLWRFVIHAAQCAKRKCFLSICVAIVLLHQWCFVMDVCIHMQPCDWNMQIYPSKLCVCASYFPVLAPFSIFSDLSCAYFWNSFTRYIEQLLTLQYASVLPYFFPSPLSS